MSNFDASNENDDIEDISVPDDIAEWEREYKLPLIEGTPRQIAWARLIRFRYLSDVFDNFWSATCDLDQMEVRAVSKYVDLVRADRSADRWIAYYNRRVRDATAMIISEAGLQPSHPVVLRAVTEAEARADQRSAATRKVTAAVGKWERREGLPTITGRTAKSVNYARRCRYALYGHRSGECPPKTDAACWIEEFRRWEASRFAATSLIDKELDRQLDAALSRDCD